MTHMTDQQYFLYICHLAGLKNEFILPSIGKSNSQIKLHSMHLNNIICQYFGGANVRIASNFNRKKIQYNL